jgi:hypothetical protein
MLLVEYSMNIVTCIPIARQRVDKHIPATCVHATEEGLPLLGNGAVNMHSWQQKTMFSVGFLQSGYKKGSAGQQ